MAKTIEKVPNQRVLTIHKEPTDKLHKYTCNNLEAIGEAARRLQSKAGFKLYMYLAKNQDKYNFALSSSDFCLWSGVGIAAYRTAFEELEKQGYLILNGDSKSNYTFYDKSQKEDEEATKDNVNVSIPKEKVEEIQQIKKQIEEVQQIKKQEAFEF
jgi:CRISPR/Cas system-associated protein Cas5 (RAMP superfamily)